MEQKIKELLLSVIHPETEKNIVDSGFIYNVDLNAQRVVITLLFNKNRDPFAQKIKGQIETLIKNSYPDLSVIVTIREEKKVTETKQKSTTNNIAKIIAIASGKGGVGKSTITANIATTLRNMGMRVGILDADIYGPSQPKMFGVEGYLPDAEKEDGVDKIIPAMAHDIKVMSIGFFIKSTDALLWRGAMAVNALKQMIHQTKWGELDYLLIDLPPGTGDIHLSIIGELSIDGAVVVSTPQQIAVADVIRGVEMFRNKDVNIPICGIIENMSWFTPAELPENKYYIFGKGGAKSFSEENDIPFLGEIPIIQSIVDGADGGQPATTTDNLVEKYYRDIVSNIVHNIDK